MGIPRPRGDKAATIRKMLELSYGGNCDEELPSDSAESSVINDGEEMSSGDEETWLSGSGTDYDSERTSDTAVSSLLTSKSDSIIVDDVSFEYPNKGKKQPEWVQNLPDTLKGMYEDQKKQRVKHQRILPCLATSPLREVVVQMHEREGAIVKYLY